MKTESPADAVREALPERVLALLTKHGGWQATLDHIADLEARLAAPAAPAPDTAGEELTDYLGAALQLESLLSAQTSNFAERAMQHAATALRIAHEKRDRLAALAGAAPDVPFCGLERIEGMEFYLHDDPNDVEREPVKLVMAMSHNNTVYCHRITDGNNGICVDETIPHAPAKAREDGPKDFIAQKFGSYWCIQVACVEGMRSYALNTDDGSLTELPSDKVPFVVMPALATFAEGE